MDKWETYHVRCQWEGQEEGEEGAPGESEDELSLTFSEVGIDVLYLVLYLVFWLYCCILTFSEVCIDVFYLVFWLYCPMLTFS